MKSNTNHKRKIPRKIASLLRDTPGALARIARSVRRLDGKRGVDRSLVTRVLAGQKKSARVERAILREATRIEKERSFQRIGKIEELARSFEV